VGAVTGVREEEAAQALRIVGREAELERLRAAVDAARMRQAQLIELVGEPGIGKSRLVEELKTLAIGFNQLTASCERYATSVPFYPFREILRPVAGIMPGLSAEEAGAHLQSWIPAAMPDLAPWLPLLAIPFDAKVEMTPETAAIDPAFRRDKLHEALEQFFLLMFLTPTLMVFEDSHWMDDSSRFALAHLMANPLGRPLLVCVTRRPEGLPIMADGSGAIELQPLGEKEAAELVLAAAEDVALSRETMSVLAERSGGNPLFVRELVAAARVGTTLDGLPESVETLITTRIDTLDAGDRVLLRYAAVIGPTFDLELLGEVLEGEQEDLHELERWRRLGDFLGWEEEDRLRFHHDLFRATAYEGLSFRRRREIHRRVGQALVRRAGERVDEEAAVLSLHFFEAGELDHAWRYAVLAGDRARASYANVVAAGLFERALAAARELQRPATEVARVAESLGDVCELFGAYERAEAAYAQAQELVSDVVASARLMRKRGVLGERLGDYDQAVDWYERALELLANDGDVESVADIELAYAGVKHRQGEFTAAIEHATRAADFAEHGGTRRALGHAYYLLDVAHTRLATPDASFRRRALPLLEEAGDLVGQSSLVNNDGVALYYEGRWDEAVTAYRRGGELSTRAGDVVNAARAANNEAEILADQGQLDQARDLFEEALRAWRAAGYRVGVALATSNLGRVAARARRFGDAHELLDRAADGFREIGATSFVHETDARRVECLVLEGRYAEARELVEATLADVRPLGATPPLALLERLAGYAVIQAREPRPVAKERFDASLAVARELGAQYEIALTLRALADTKCADDPDAALRESEEILEQLGVVSLATPALP
jgi:tetratricopeptide (TPR) repeat protein